MSQTRTGLPAIRRADLRRPAVGLRHLGGVRRPREGSAAPPTKRGTAMSIDEDTVTTIGTRSQPVVDVGRGAGSRSCARTRGRC